MLFGSPSSSGRVLVLAQVEEQHFLKLFAWGYLKIRGSQNGLVNFWICHPSQSAVPFSKTQTSRLD